MSDASSTSPGEAALRVANARLRQVVEAKDAEIAALKAGFAAELARLEARVAELERRLGQDSSNSSLPPGSDGPGAKARRRAARSQRERSADRKPGAQPGHPGWGVEPIREPDRTERVAAAVACSGCGAGLVDGADAGSSW